MSKEKNMRTLGYRTSLLFAAIYAFLLFASSSALATPAPPSVEATAPYSVGATIATLKAQINPNGEDTTYRFEYGPTSSYGTVVPVGGGDIGSGVGVVNVVDPVQGLFPQTVYHYRVVATNHQGTVASADEIFSTFGVAEFDASVTNADGSPDVLAGSHPFELSSHVKFAKTESVESAEAGGAVRDMDLELPVGMAGEPQAVPQCPREKLNGECPVDSQIGVLTVELGGLTATLPLYNLVPVDGATAQFGAFVAILPLTLTAVVQPNREYSLSMNAKELIELLPVRGIAVTLWGVPGDPSHDTERRCLNFAATCPSGAGLKPFLTLPTVCGAPQTFTLRTDSWAQPGEFVTATSTGENKAGQSLNVMGCDRLDFSPSLGVQSDATAADSPTGFTLTVDIPQSNSATGVAEADLKSMVLTLPEGMSIDVSAADGLGACTSSEIGLETLQAPSCPDSSKIGTAQISTPLLPLPLTGSIYLARQGENPFNSQFAAYVYVEGSGVKVKLAMELLPDPSTGQLTVKLDKAPQLGFAQLKLAFNGGPRAVLASPTHCGTFPTVGHPTSYAESASAIPPVVLSSDIVVSSDCADGFAPSFVAGATSTEAGQDTGFTLKVDRADAQQTIHSLSASLPDGLLAKLGSVPRCGAPAAAAGTCDANTRVGTATIAAGAGTHPFYLKGGAFLTGPYAGAPFGLSIVVPAVAGPFDLGTVAIRARLLIGRRDGRLTLATDQIPSILGGIPLRIRTIAVTIDRPGFMFNPTSCTTQQIDAQIEGQQITAPVTSPFTVAGCSRLAFAPSVSASTQARVSRQAGAAFDLKIGESGSAGANIRSIRAVFPSQLAPRLTAIQHACLRATFDSNPALCPKGSRVGSAEAKTSLLAGPLKGPAYFLSNATTAPAELAIVLQGEGIVLELVGTLRVSHGVSTIVFKTVPDAPISNLDVSLPAGADSMLGASGLSKSQGMLCGKRLVLRTTLTGQNNRSVKRSSVLSVQGCRRTRR
jgi:hypothetical protein